MQLIWCDSSALTGEALPIAKTKGTKTIAKTAVVTVTRVIMSLDHITCHVIVII